MAKYETVINGKTFQFEAINDTAAGRAVDAETKRQGAESGSATTAAADTPPKKDSVEEYTSKVFGSDPAERAGAIAEQQGKKAGVARTAGLALQQGTLRNFGDEIGALGAASGLPVGTPPIISAPIGAAKRLFGAKGAEDTYNEELARLRGYYKGASETNPTTALAGEVTGGFAGPGGPGGSLARRVVGGAAVAGADAALAGAGAGTDAESRTSGAITGGVVGGGIGGALPLAGNLVSRVARPFLGARGVEGEAAGAVRGALRADIDNPADLARRANELRPAYDRGQPVVLGDVGGQTTRDLARQSGNVSSQAWETLSETTQPRFANQAERATGWWDNLTGAPNALQTREGLRQAAQRENRPNYERAYNAGSSVWNEELRTLTGSPTVQQAIKDASKTSADYAAHEGFPMVRNPFVQGADGTLSLPAGTTPSLQFWDHVQRNLREAAERAPPGGEEARRIGGLRNQLNSHLDAAVPEFSHARDVARGYFGQGDALEAGQGFLDMPARGGHAEERAAFQTMTPAERELFGQGLTESVRNRLASTNDNQALERLWNNPEMRSRLEMGLGTQRAGELQQYLRVERTMSQLRQAMGNSTTAKQLMDLGLLTAGGATLGGGAGGGLGAVLDSQGNVQMPSAGAVLGGFGAFLKGRNARTNVAVANRVAEMLTSQDTRVLREGVRILNSNAALRDAFEQFSTRLGAVAGQQTGASQAGGPQ